MLDINLSEYWTTLSNMGIFVEQYRSRISHDNFLKIKDALSFSDRFWNNADDVIHECFLFTNIETNCWTIQNMKRSSVLVYPGLRNSCTTMFTCHC